MSGQIRAARVIDLAAIDRLSRQAAEQDYDRYPATIRKTIARRNGWLPVAKSLIAGRRQVLVLEVGGQVSGCLVGTPNTDGVAVVHWLYVAPAARGGGYARKLLEEFEVGLESLPVHAIMVWTEVAAGYYERLGWHQAGKLENHWWGQTFYLFSKPVAASQATK